MSIRVACVRFLNTAPLVEGLDQVEGLTLVPTVPSRIGEMVEKDEADLGLASIVDAVRLSRPLQVIPVGMIGCDGPTLTVRVFSSVPLDRVKRLHADTDSHTSVILARLLLARRAGSVPEVVDFDVRERVERGGSGQGMTTGTLDTAWPETVLLIGDKVVTDPPPAERYPHQLDLGAAWKEWTGLPFVYAAWMARDGESAAVHSAAGLLDRQRRRNAMRMDWIVEKRAPLARWPVDLARKYLTELLKYEVGPRERAAANRFIAEAAGAGLLPGRTLSWGTHEPG